MKLSKVKKASRNSLCSCGSGKKYKKCCLPKEQKSIEAEKLFNLIKDKKKVEDKVEEVLSPVITDN